MQEIISIKNISVQRGGKQVLKNITWNTYKGENWFVMGENGSGKTTLIEILVGYLWAQDGKVCIMGEEFGHTNLRDLRTKVGYVSSWIMKRMQSYTLVEDVVASGIDGSVGSFDHKSEKLMKEIKNKLEFFKCTDLAGRKFGTLSSGQQLKCILARAMINNPKLLILDEPFSMLDVGSRIDLYEHITELCNTESAPQIIMVTHHKEDIIPIFTHGIIIKDGKTAVQGLREAVLNPSVFEKMFGINANNFEKYFSK